MESYKLQYAVACDGCCKNSTNDAIVFNTKWLTVDVDGVFYNLCPDCIVTRTNLKEILEAKEESNGISKSIDDN